MADVCSYLKIGSGNEIPIADDDMRAYIEANGPGAHNSIYREVNLGTSFTNAQHTALSSGNFNGMYIGSFWTIGNIKYVIKAFDYWYNCGDTALQTHHALVGPESAMYDANMNTSNVTTGGYYGSAMVSNNLATAITYFNNAFGSTHVLKHRDFLSNAVSNGMVSGMSWYDRFVDLESQRMVYGNQAFGGMNQGNEPGGYCMNYQITKSQLPYYAFRPEMQSNRQYIWLRDVVSSAGFADVGYGGACDNAGASNSFGVRPFALIS